MKPATEEFLLEYCKAILNADSEEDLLLIKNEMIEQLKEFNYTEELIEEFFTRADSMLNNENDYEILEHDIYSETNSEQITPQTNPNVTSNMNTGVLVGGVGVSAIIAAIALKRKVLAKNKKKSR